MLTPPVSARDHALGPENAPITLVEYGDYESPVCRGLYTVLLLLRQELGDSLQYVFRHFPLIDLHPHAQRAAEAAECAGTQGKFWQMHHLLISHPNGLHDGEIVGYADKLGLDVMAFVRCMKVHRFAGCVREHFESGYQSGVTGAPTLFINGICYCGPLDYNALREALAHSREARLELNTAQQ